MYIVFFLFEHIFSFFNNYSLHLRIFKYTYNAIENPQQKYIK